MYKRALAAGLLALAVGAATSYRLAVLSHRDTVAAARVRVAASLDPTRASLSREVFAAVHLTEGLVALVRLRAGIQQEEFQAMAAAITARSAVTRNVALAPGTVIRYMYPLEGNQSAIGVDYRDVPGQRDMVLRAIAERHTVVAGPLQLVQGGVGIIGRTPIYLLKAGADKDAVGEYWGIAATVVSFDRLIEQAGLPQASRTLRIALRGRDGTGATGPPFWGDATVFDQEPVVLNVPLPSGNWAIAAVPVDGWPAFSWFTLEWLGGLAVSLLLAGLLFAAIQVGHDRRLEMIARRRTEDELRHAMAEVERNQRLAALSLFAGGVAHDFNNLLAGLFGNIELARATLPAGSPATQHLDTASAAFERARDLTRRLLTFAIGTPPQRRALTAARFVQECCALSLSGSPTSWTLECPDGPATREILGDGNQLSQVFTNILMNARQAMPDGGHINVLIRNRDVAPGQVTDLPAGPYLEVTLTDDGPGIPAETLPRVFEPFFTTKPEGSGLGLAMAYSITQAHGGRVSASSSPGGGATFRVLLPGAATGSAEQPGSVVAFPPAVVARGRILLMDDEQLIRDMASRMLARGGYEVVTTRDGREAIDRFDEALAAGTPFDAVILDVTVQGGMGGIEALRLLRERRPEVAVVLSSGYAEVGIAGSECQPTAVLPKPYQMHELLACARAVIGAQGKA